MDIHKLEKQSFGYIPGPSGETPMSNLQRLLSRWVSMMQKSLPKQQGKKRDWRTRQNYKRGYHVSPVFVWQKNMRYTSWHGHITNNYQQIKNQSWNMTGTNRQQSWSHANTGVWWLKMSTNITTKPILTRHSLWDNYPNMVSWLRHHGKQNDKQRMNIQEKTWCQRLQHESFLDVSDLRSS